MSHDAAPVALDIEQLSVVFDTPDGPLSAVNDFSLAIRRGECVGVVGESGAGKSQSFLAVMGLLAANARVSGQARLGSEPLINRSVAELNQFRGVKLSMIFQDPMTSLTPHMTVGEQIAESIIHHLKVSEDAARARALALLEQVQVTDAPRRLDQYPHELSGGMRQRVMIAIALACDPEVLIADEPTTALDVTIQAQILALLAKLKRERGMAMALITHDLGVVAGIADRVAVMYAGRVVELGTVQEVLKAPKHPYTAALLASMPRIDDAGTGPLPAIGGQPPNPRRLPAGCAFGPRCERADDACRAQRPPLTSLTSTVPPTVTSSSREPTRSSDPRHVACHHPLERP